MHIVLLERDSALQDFYDSAEHLAQSGKVALISGEAGIGKTAFLEHVRRKLSGDIRILRSGCDPLFTPRPYAPLQDFSQALPGDWCRLLESSEKV
jgi:predicted ATPase